MFEMWVGIEASVPIPYCSIFSIRSASDKNPGGYVLFSVILNWAISIISPI
jgi:hypothetical protein